MPNSLINGKTTRKLLTFEGVCPNCGREYKRLPTHWKGGGCNYPEISEHALEVLTGSLMGDGNYDYGKVSVSNTNLDYLRHLFWEIGFVAKPPKLKATGVELEEYYNQYYDGTQDIKPGSRQDMYRVRTMRHPDLYHFGEWYESGSKKYPDDLELTPTIVKHWYCGDGGLRKRKGRRNNALITCKNESDRIDWVAGLFEDVGFGPGIHNGYSISFTVDETPEFLDWMGEPPEGMEYKWQWRDYM